MGVRARRAFRDRPADEHPQPDLNPYVRLHREYAEIVPGDQAPSYRGRWSEVFGREAPLHLEIGTGNGSFLAAMALAHAEWDFLGVEIRFKRVVQGAKRIRAADLSNARMVRYDAFFLADLFAPASLAAIYLNHPDPWPKGKHEKNRLISKAFLSWAADTLVPGAGLPRVKASISKLAPGATVIRRFPFARALDTLRGQRISVSVEDVESGGRISRSVSIE